MVDLIHPGTYPELEDLLAGDPDRLADFSIATGESAEAAWPLPDNMGLIKHQGQGSPLGLEAGGYDTIEALLWGQWDEGLFDDLISRIEAARDGGGGEGGWLSVGTETVCAWARGVRRGLWLSWVLEWKGITIGIVNRTGSTRSGWGLWVRLGSLACMDMGGVECWTNLLRFLGRLGFRVEGNILSRVDVCVELLVPCHVIVEQYCLRRCVMRGRNGQVFESGRRFTGFTRGSGKRIMLRVYDKLAELGESAEDLLKERLLVQRRWGCQPESATRVEFQLRRDALGDFGISSVEEFFGRAGEVVRWLCADWFRFVDGVPDGHHSCRLRTSELWQTVQLLFREVFGAGVEADRVKRVLSGDAAGLVSQAVGCFSSALAVAGEVPATVGELVERVVAYVAERGSEVLRAVREKRARLEAMAGGISLVGAPQPVSLRFREFDAFAGV